MPIYEYECQSCGRRTETMQKISDPPLATCPVCQGGPMKRLVSAPAFHLKGTGWYVTDYARKDAGGKAREGGEGGGEKPAEKAAERPSGEATSGGGDKAAAKPAGDAGAKSSSAGSSGSSTAAGG